MKKLNDLIIAPLIVLWTIFVFLIGSRDLWFSNKFKSGFESCSMIYREKDSEDRIRNIADGVAFAIESRNPKRLYRELTGKRYNKDTFYTEYRKRRHIDRSENYGIGGP